jgi:ABC-type lipopolysaccharide export system ATPase subunit
MNEKAEEIKKKYAYRQMILKGQIKLTRKTAVKLIGPDTAYHLYSQKESKNKNPK